MCTKIEPSLLATPDGSPLSGAMTPAEAACERSISLSATAAPWRTSHTGDRMSTHSCSHSAANGHAPATMSCQAAAASSAAAAASCVLNACTQACTCWNSTFHADCALGCTSLLIVGHAHHPLVRQRDPGHKMSRKEQPADKEYFQTRHHGLESSDSLTSASVLAFWRLL